ncbi:diguanylate cyclase (GGDEF)-like protein [Chelatococcus caeni]|uniref:diguanylate cyclase n=1 Tax=Chelatococcus caeni TaxID=1348468 RepID=A0A840C1C1_9HYPH|nr:diguanylate cyclase (GGDEF)-like protein [Chelatococcus caeni]
MLDLVTALVLWSSATATVAVVLFIVWWRNRAFVASLWWSGAFALMSAGRLLLALRGHVADTLAIEIAVALSLAGFSLSLTGFSVLDRLRPRPWFLLPLGLWVLGCLTPAFAASGSFRIMLAHGTAGLAYLLHVAVLRRAGRRSPARHWLSQIFWFAAGLNLVSLVLAALFPPADFFSYRFAAVALVAGLAALVATVIAGARLLVEETEQGLRQLVETDPLTGALNRRGLAQRFDAMTANGRRDPPLLAMLVFDLDHFKRVNDRHGHQAGDLALAHFARIAAASLREGDAFARLGGEEFAACLPVSSLAEAKAVAERIQGALGSTPLSVEGRFITITSSVGVSTRPRPTATLDELIAAGDRALYAAKAHGRNCIMTDDDTPDGDERRVRQRTHVAPQE